MLRFKQYLLEAPLIDDFSAHDKPGHRGETDRILGDRMVAIQRTERESGKKHKAFAHLGPYTLYHAPPTGEWPEHSVLVKHGKQVVGHVSFTVRKNTSLGGMQIARHLDATEMPRFLRAHSGNRAKIPHLASRVYMATAKHFGMPVLSGSQQTPGGQSVWHGIAKLTGNVKAVNIDSRKEIPNYDPRKHSREVYDTENSRGANWILMHDPKQNLSEVFTPRPDLRDIHPDMTSDGLDTHGSARYTHIKNDKDGNRIYRLRTSIDRVNTHSDPYNGWTEIEFTVNGTWDKEHLDPEHRVGNEHILDGAKKVFSHVNHYHSQVGLGKGILFATKNRKKHDLYMRMAKRFGVPAVNAFEDKIQDT